MNWKKVLGTLLMAGALLLAMGASAMAEDIITPVPKNQFNYIAPMGMEDALHVTAEDGSLTVAIDDSKVDWALAFASTGG